jgi:hypothetical protein
MILNRASDGSGPVLLVLWRALRECGSMSKEKLLAFCAPESIGDDTAKRTLNRWTQMGLFVEEDNKLRLGPTFDNLETDGDLEYRAFRREVRRLALSKKSNLEFLKPEPRGAADFTFVIAWLLSTDVNADHLRSPSDIQRFEREQVEPLIGESDENKYALQNTTRWNGFQDWASFLGFGWNASSFQLDPTEAIGDELEGVFAGQADLTADGFVQRLGERLPVVDSGEYFVRARERAKDGWRPIKDRELSPALSRALLRFEDAGRLVLEARADADSRELLGVAFTHLRSVSHIRLQTLGR